MSVHRLILTIILSCIMSGQMIVCSQTLQFPDNHCDFGAIYEKDGVAVREFQYRNDQKDTVVICQITTGCRCINGEPSFEKVAPGHKGSVKISFDPAYRSGPFEYVVSLWYKNRQERQIVTVKGEVIPMLHPITEDHPYNLGGGLYTSHKVLPLGSIRPGESRKMFFRYGNATDKPMELEFVVEGCLANVVEMDRHLTLAPDERGKMYVTVKMPHEYSGKHINYIWPVVDGVRLENPILLKVTTKE